MVDYQGPESIRRFIEALEIPIFDRVHEIGYRVTSLKEIPLKKAELARLHELKQISISRRGAKPFDESEIEAAAALVPACRLASVGNSDHQISIKVHPGSRLGCLEP